MTQKATSLAATVAALLAALPALVLVAACSSGSERVTGGGSAGPSGLSPGPTSGSTSSDEPLASIDTSGGAGSEGPAASAGSSTHDSTKAPRYPSPAGMQPPTATAATAGGCDLLAGGGWRATFLVTLVGGDQWAVVPELGPATPTGSGVWRIVIEEAAPKGNSVTLSRVKVGGGSPFRTAYVPLPPGVAVTASCPS